jgi:hypothetical protein
MMMMPSSLYEQLSCLWMTCHDYHNQLVSQLVAFVMEQTIDGRDPQQQQHHHHNLQLSTPSQQNNLPESYGPIKNIVQHLSGAIPSSTKTDDEIVVLPDTNNPTSSSTTSDPFIYRHSNCHPYDDYGTIVPVDASLVVGDVTKVVIHPHHCGRNFYGFSDNGSIIPIPVTTTTSPSSCKTSHQTSSSLSSSGLHRHAATTTTMTVDNHYYYSSGALVQNSTDDCSMDWNDTMTALIIRLTMITLLCYLFVISQP